MIWTKKKKSFFLPCKIISAELLELPDRESALSVSLPEKAAIPMTPAMLIPFGYQGNFRISVQYFTTLKVSIFPFRAGPLLH